jgi:hypothetical protein
MEDLAKVYYEIMTCVNKLAGIDQRQRTERLVFDKQISGGKCDLFFYLASNMCPRSVPGLKNGLRDG